MTAMNRTAVTAQKWNEAVVQLTTGERTLLGLWGDPPHVHMALLDESAGVIAVLTYACTDGKFPSVSAKHPPALRLERAILSLFGLEPVGLPDTRPWLDHGVWDVAQPLAVDKTPTRLSSPSATTVDLPLSGGGRAPYQFLPSEGEGLHQIPVGPVHAGIIEPGHFRFTCNGEHVVRLEARLGYVHKGIEGLMQGAPLEAAAKLACRTSGDSAVAYALAFAQAAEAALQIEPPPRAVYLRALMAELERLAHHFGDIGAICNDASFAIMHAQTGILRERTLRAADACFGHRLMMDGIVPGGVARDIGADGTAQMSALIGEVRRVFPRLIELYDNTASLQDRTVTSGILKPELVRQYGAGGPVGRASGRNFDARRMPGAAPYDALSFDVPVRSEGDVNARIWIRIREVEQSLSLIEQILARLPDGELRAAVKPGGEACEGLGLAEAFRGDVLVWLRLDGDGRVKRCHLRDASWFQWPLLEVAIEGNIVADFPLCNKSFNCSYSGHDL
jgi:Ni,Fe-hydrogenase III large subunit/Ni,Fe-hydrogenase III component G